MSCLKGMVTKMNLEHYNLASTSTEVSRSGLPTDTDVKEIYNRMVAYLKSKLVNTEHKLHYDVTFLGDGNDLVYCRIFNGHLLLRTSNATLNEKMLGTITQGDRDFTIPNKPKYGSLPYRHTATSKSIFYLCGSNLIGELVNSHIRGYMADGVVFKYHPITDRLDRYKLADAMTLDAIPGWIDAYQTLPFFDKVYSPPTSEMGLVAKLLGKEVVRVALRKTVAYSHLYHNLDKFPLIARSTKSGIIRPTHYEEDIDGYLAHYANHQSDIKVGEL